MNSSKLLLPQAIASLESPFHLHVAQQGGYTQLQRKVYTFLSDEYSKCMFSTTPILYPIPYTLLVVLFNLDFEYALV